MANRRPTLLDATGAVVFAPSEAADTVTPYTSPPIKLTCNTGKRIIIFTLDGSDNLTVTETDIAGNTIGCGIVVNGTNVPVGTQLVFSMPPTNLSLRYKAPSVAQPQVSSQTGVSGADVFAFVNGNTGVNQPNRAFAGTTLEVGEGIGGQVAE